MFKSPISNEIYVVAWQEGDYAWFVSEDCHYGDFSRVDDPIWKYTERSRANPQSRLENPVWKIGDLVSRGQRYYRGKVIAVGNKCVLLENLHNGQIQPDSNENMKKYYRREG